MITARECCTGNCRQGRDCPHRFAPGVIDGPHKRTPWLSRLRARMRRISMFLDLILDDLFRF